MMTSSISALAADQTTAKNPSTTTTVSSTSVSSSSADSEDPQAYREQHPKTVTQEQTISSVMLFANTTVKSIYTGNSYVLPAGATITQGIDVSKWDSTINWTKVKAAGTDFAIIRVGYRGYSNGTIYADPTYATNMTNANKAGVPAGIYIYSQATTVAEAKEEAQYCISKASGYNIQLPIVMDLEFAEDSSGYTGRLYNANLSKAAQTKVCLALCDTVAAAGYTPMIYANAFMLREHTNAAALSAACPIWMASFPTSRMNVSGTTYSTSYTGDYDIWQYSEWGNVSGISPIIDCNFGINLNISGSSNNGGNSGTTIVPVEAQKITLNQTTAELKKGETTTLSATITPSNSTESVTWKSSDSSVASVSDSGKVTAVTPGTAVITATAGKKSASCTIIVKPEQTTMQILQQTANGNVLTWNAAAGAEKYAIYRSTTGTTGSYSKIGTVTATTYTDKTADLNQKYYYRVAGQFVVSGTTYTGTRSTVINTSNIPTRSTVRAITQSSRRVRLTWTASQGATQYYIYRSKTGQSGSFKHVKTVTGTSYRSSKLTAGQRYYYRIVPVRTINGILYRGRVSTTTNIRIR
jgi:GH25 family lysozyme M1 (1,4-beta-N-acetylmuramidase)